MKYLMAVFTLALLGAFTSYAAAQSTHHHGPKVGPQASEINYRMRGQWKLIKEGTESGKLSAEQATDLKNSLKSIHEQEVADIKQNGNNDITADQATAFNQTLDQNLTKLGAVPGADHPVPQPIAAN